MIELPADYVLQIINKVVQEYWEDVFQDPTSSLSLLDTFCKKVAFVDFALQAITEASIREECKALMQKLDLIVLTTKSTMNAKWYEVRRSFYSNRITEGFDLLLAQDLGDPDASKILDYRLLISAE